MAAQFTSCPACGAVGEIGNACQFCGTTVIQKEGVVTTNARVVDFRTVSPQEYANKIAIYHKIETKGKLSVVRIGDQRGVINLNGDLVYPLTAEYEFLSIISDLVIHIGYDKHLNIETLEECIADNFSSGSPSNGPNRIIDKNNPQYFHRIYDLKTWKIDNVYTNNKGETQNFNYAESLSPNTNVWLLHKDDSCTFMYGDEWNGWDLYHAKKHQEYYWRDTFFIENVKSVGKIIKQGNREYYPLELVNGEKIKFPLYSYDGYTSQEKKDHIPEKDWWKLYYQYVIMKNENYNLEETETKESDLHEKPDFLDWINSNYFLISMFITALIIGGLFGYCT